MLLCGSYPTGGSTGARFQPSDRSSLQLQDNFHADSTADAHDMYGDDTGGDWGGGDDYYEEGDGAAADPFPHFADTSAPMVMGTPAKVKASLPSTTLAPPVAASSSSSSSVAPKRRSAPSKDMFAQLDPHLALATSREARRGKTYKIPTSLAKAPQNPAEYCLDHLYADIKATNTTAFLSCGAVPSKGLFDTSLLPILQLKRKQIRAARLADIRSSHLTERIAQPTLGDEMQEPLQFQNLHTSSAAGHASNISAIANTSRVEELWSQDYADDADFGGDYGGGDDYDGPEDYIAGERNAFGEGASGAAENFLASVAEKEGHFGGGEDWAAEETEEEALARRVANVLSEELSQSNRGSYESICQKYIDNFNQGAHLFAK